MNLVEVLQMARYEGYEAAMNHKQKPPPPRVTPGYKSVWDLSQEAYEAEQDEANAIKRALSWVSEVHPGKNEDGAAVVEMTWEQWNALRKALGLRRHSEPRKTRSALNDGFNSPDVERGPDGVVLK